RAGSAPFDREGAGRCPPGVPVHHLRLRWPADALAVPQLQAVGHDEADSRCRWRLTGKLKRASGAFFILKYGRCPTQQLERFRCSIYARSSLAGSRPAETGCFSQAAQETTMQNIPPVIVALDYAVPAEAEALAARLDPSRCRLKVGKELFTRSGPE